MKEDLRKMNKVILMGRLTRDPEVRYTSTNNTLVDKVKKDKQIL